MASDIIQLFETHGGEDYISEPLTQTEHMIQTAMLAEENGEASEMIMACLLHDLGHLLEIRNKSSKMGTLGVRDHETVGQDYLLSIGFGQKIANLVGNHVKAKRYLVAVCKDYGQNLSEASRQTLQHQGGLMTQSEAAEFRADPLFKESIRLRAYDDAAKVGGLKVRDIEYYREMLERHCK